MTSRILVIALALSSGHLSAQEPLPSVKISNELTVAEMHADFDMLRAALEEAHGGLYRYVSSDELGRRFDADRGRIDHPMTRVEFIGLVSETLAAIRDGHTRLEYNDETSAALTAARLVPLRVMQEGTRLMVLSNQTPHDSTIRPGMEVLSINGRAATEILGLIDPKMPRDGFIETGKKRRIDRLFADYYWLFVEQVSEYTIAAQDDTGATVTATLAGLRKADRDASANPVNRQLADNLARLGGPEDRVSLEFVSDPDIAHLRIRSFGGQQFPASIETAFRTLRERGTEALVLDLRGNGGGVDEYGALLVSQFVDHPFRYFDRIHVKTIDPSFTTWVPRTYEDLRLGTVPADDGGYLVLPRLHPGMAEQEPALVPFLGQVYVLIDGRTFSTAADVTAHLKDLGRATFIGEETGGTYEGNTSGLNARVDLPNSGLRLKVMMYGYWNAVQSDGRGRGTLPDYPVETRVADLIAGVDAQLQHAVELAQAGVGGSR